MSAEKGRNHFPIPLLNESFQPTIVRARVERLSQRKDYETDKHEI